MVKENKSKFNDLIALRKVGEGKVSLVDYSFIIDKDYKARVELGMNNENSHDKVISDRVQLGEDEIIIVDTFINNFMKDKKNKLPLFDDSIDYYEYEQLLYDNIVVEDEELNNKFRTIVDFIQSEHKEIGADSVTEIYNMMIGNITGRKK